MRNPLPASPFAGGGAFLLPATSFAGGGAFHLQATSFAGGGACGSPDQGRIGITLATHATDSELAPSPGKGRVGVGLKQQPD